MPSGAWKRSYIVILITRRFHVALLAAVVISVIVSLAGVWLSFFIDSAPSDCCIIVRCLYRLFLIVTVRETQNRI
jgi:manganese/iron transport system permease protein